MSSPAEPAAVIGTGVLRNARGQLLLDRASYRLRVRRDDVDGWKPIEGHILNPPTPWGFPISAIGADVVLETANGRHWLCILVDHRGHLISRGMPLPFGR